jgi:putative aminopeptidase FrvX
VEEGVEEVLRALSEAYGPSGNESEVRELIRGMVESYADELRVDALGNLMAIRHGPGKRVMVAAHMDEIGVIVSHVDDKGFLRFSNIGGLQNLTLLGNRVRFADGTVGVIGCEKLEDRSKVPELSKLFIDVGASSKGEVRVRVGDMGVIDRSFAMAGSRAVGKAMDDRAGCAALVLALRKMGECRHDVYFTFTTQEEIGLRGATASGFGVDPEVALAVDVTATGDTPKAPTMAVSLGGGAAIKVRDGGMLAHPGVKELLVRRAEERGLPYQLEVLEGGTTDARAIQTSRAGVPTGVISIPCRYIHTASEMIDLGDLESAVNLLLAFLEGEIEL